MSIYVTWDDIGPDSEKCKVVVDNGDLVSHILLDDDSAALLIERLSDFLQHRGVIDESGEWR